MINISFTLNNQKIDAHNEAPIYYLLTFNGNRIRQPIKGAKVRESEWIKQRGRVRKNSINRRGVSGELINAKLEELEENVRRINKVALRENVKIDKEYVLGSLESPGNIDTDNFSFFEAFEEYIESGKSQKAKRTIMNYGTVKAFLFEFEKQTKYHLNFESINLEFFDAFRTYSFSKKNIADNYFSKIVAVLRSFLNWATDRNYNQNLDYKKFRAPEREKEIIFLTKEELFTLYHFPFESERLRHVRDVFCFACFTGLRYSDVKNLRANNINNDYLITNIQKTKEVGSKIPLNKYSKEILKRYEDGIFNPLPIISEQKYNAYIKECCELVGIDDEVSITEYRGSQSVRKSYPKYQLITSHVARKTFVTNSLILGMKEVIVRNITGHKREASFRKYVKIADDVKKNEMENTWDKLSNLC